MVTHFTWPAVGVSIADVDDSGAATVIRAQGVLSGILADAVKGKRLAANPVKGLDNLPRKSGSAVQSKRLACKRSLRTICGTPVHHWPHKNRSVMLPAGKVCPKRVHRGKTKRTEPEADTAVAAPK